MDVQLPTNIEYRPFRHPSSLNGYGVSQSPRGGGVPSPTSSLGSRTSSTAPVIPERIPLSPELRRELAAIPAIPQRVPARPTIPARIPNVVNVRPPAPSRNLHLITPSALPSEALNNRINVSIGTGSVIRTDSAPQTRNSAPELVTIVSLDQLRTWPRVQNDYVDSPPLPLQKITHSNGCTRSAGSLTFVGNRIQQTSQFNNSNNSSQTSKPSIKPFHGDQHQKPDSDNVITSLDDTGQHGHDCDSILCPRCRRCRCQGCCEKKQLPSKWLCDEKVHISADSVIECCTCLWCVKGIFYHCGNVNPEDSDIAEDPCACCAKPNCFTRWLLLSFMSLLCPCLCLYLPCKAAVKGCGAMYNRCTNKGCRCSNSKHKKSKCGKSKLLESDSSSS